MNAKKLVDFLLSEFAYPNRINVEIEEVHNKEGSFSNGQETRCSARRNQTSQKS